MSSSPTPPREKGGGPSTGRAPAASPSREERLEQEREKAASALTELGVALRQRDQNRRAVVAQPLGSDPTTAAPAGWNSALGHTALTAAATAQPLPPAAVATERSALLWTAVAKIVGAVIATAIAVAFVTVFIISGLES